MPKIFVVDDEQFLLEGIVRILETRYEVSLQAVSAEDGFKKIQEAKAVGCTVAVLDGLGGQGREVASRLREAIPHIRIVSCSASWQNWSDAHVDKPFTAQELLEAIGL